MRPGARVTVRQARTIPWTWVADCSDPRCGRLGRWWSWRGAMRKANAHALAHRFDRLRAVP